MEITVCKYGGSSLAGDHQVVSVAEKIARKHHGGAALIVVVSARGKTTDELLEEAEKMSRLPDPRETDKLLATGEQASAALLAIALRGMGVPAESYSGPDAGLRAVGDHGAGVISTVDARPLREGMEKGVVAVVAGFQALNEEGRIITLGRGGSDTTAVALAVAHGARKCEIYTDVDGVHRADPRILPQAHFLSRIDARMMAEMAFSGAGVMHSRAVELAAVHGIDVVVRNSEDRPRETVIVGRNPKMPEEQPLEGRAGVVAVTHDADTAQVIVQGGRETTVVDVLDRMRVPVDAVIWWAVPAGELRMAFCVPESLLERVLPEVEPVVGKAGGSVWTRRSLGKVSFVGTGLLSRPGLTAAALAALSRHGIEAECVSTSQARTTFLVARDRIGEAVAALYEEFRLEFENESDLELTGT